MDWIKYIMYFKVLIENKLDNTFKITFIPKELIHDIYFDNTNHIIPYTNGKCYLVYQDITFKILEYLEKVSPKSYVQLNKELKIPEIIVTGKIDDELLSKINRIMTNYINSKFSLFVGQGHSCARPYDT
jgi:hypothetical protein